MQPGIGTYFEEVRDKIAAGESIPELTLSIMETDPIQHLHGRIDRAEAERREFDPVLAAEIEKGRKLQERKAS